MNNKIDLAQKYLDMVKTILSNQLKDIDAKVFIFGSRVRGKAKRASDIDLAIKFSEKQPYSIISDLKYEFEESYLPYMVDILNLDEITESFKNCIKDDLVELIYK